MGGAGRHGKIERGTNRADSRWFRRGRTSRYPDRESARGESAGDRVESKPGLSETNRRGIAIDYSKTKFEDIAKDVDVVLDSVGGETLERSYGVVKKGGIIVSIMDEPKRAALDAHGIRGESLICVPKAVVLEQLADLMKTKKLTPVVSQTFPLMDVVKAQEQIATRHTRGKIVLEVSKT